jgi:hypothetical protein
MDSNMFSRRDDNAIKGYYGLSCPEGQYYICDGDETEFIGCCTSNPCGANKGVCPQANLRSATFSGDNYANLAAQNCSNSEGTMNWWTCKFTKPPFMGCCSINACGKGECPQANLVPAKLSSIETNRLTFLDPEGNGGVSPSPSASASATSSAPSATSTGGSDDSGLGTGALVGISVGATLGALVVLGFLFWKCFWVPRKRKQGQPMTEVAPNEYQPQTPASAGFAHHGQSPQNQYNRSFTSSPNTAYYPSGTPHDIQKYGWSPAQQYDRPVSYGWTDASGMTPQMNQQVPPGSTSNPQLVPQQQQVTSPQEMDASTTMPQELAGEDHHPSNLQSSQDHQQQAIQETQQSPTYGHNQLGIRRDN